MTEDELGISKETIRQILREHLRERMIYAMQSRLTEEQKQRRLASCQELIQTCQGNPSFLIAFSHSKGENCPQRRRFQDVEDI
jgi:hypothetical protein